MSFNISTVWRYMSTEAIDTVLRSTPVRSWALRMGERQLYRRFVGYNPANFPLKMQQMRARAMTNLLHSVSKALADGRIAPQVRRSIVKNFLGKVVIGQQDRQRPYRTIHGINPPTFVTVSPTKRCNLRCLGCYANSSSLDGNTLPYSVFHRIIEEKRNEWGSHFTVISGGKPLMYRSEGKDLLDLFAEHPDNYFMFYTNGTLITERVAGRLAELGNATPAISIEGWEAETDARRGKGVFTRIKAAMENLKRAGVPFGISVTATRANAETVLEDRFMDYYFDELGAIYGWVFQYMPIGRSYTVDLMITPEQRRMMLNREMELVYEKNRFMIDFWNGGPMSVGCIAAGKAGGYFYIDWNGNIAPCVFFPYYLANINDLYRDGQTISAVLESDFFKKIRTWQQDYLHSKDEVGDLFHPCPIRDHYDFAYETIREQKLHPLDENAAAALKDGEYRKRMIEYGKETGRILDPLWHSTMYASNAHEGDAEDGENEAGNPVSREMLSEHEA